MFSSSYPINSQLGQEDHLTQNQPQLFPPNFDPDNFNDLLLAIQLLPNNSNNIGSSVPQPPLPQISSHEIEATATAAAATDLVRPSVGGLKRTMRKDRHSKIVTAKGPRDRRMRLSLDVAKKFFDLQDLLGFDKASKTVEWLLTKSRRAIRSLTSCGRSVIQRNHSNGSSISDCDEEEEEEEEEEMVAVEGEVVGSDHQVTKTGTTSTTTRTSVGRRTPRKVLTKPKILKESRVKARARARERTMEKRMSILGNSRFGHQNLQQQQPNNLRSAAASYVDCGESSATIPTTMRMMMTMMGNDQQHDPTFGCNNNFSNQIQVDPLNVYQQEGWNNFFQSSSTAATAEEQQNITNQNFHQRGWDVFNNQNMSSF